MFIKELELKNFRGFENKKIQFKKQFSVLAGENGSGKTGVLEALSVALGGWVYGFDGLDGKDKRGIYKSDVRYIPSSINTAYLPQCPVEVACTARVENSDISWSKTLNSINGRTTHAGLFEINKVTKKMNKKIYAAKDEDVILPVVAYYSTARLWTEPIIKATRYERDSVRTEGYSKALSFEQSIKNAMNYIDKAAHKYIKSNSQDYEFPAIMNSLQKSVESFTDNASIDYDISSAELVINVDGECVNYSQLSDGYRCVISLIADVIYRMATLNPHLKEKITETPGVVLIDEIDLHLHPKWQKVVVGDLKKIFPNVQFVCTTHSPFIIQSLDEGELISLDNVELAEYSGKSIEDIAETVMDVEIPQYSDKKIEMYNAASNYFAALNKATNNKELALLKEELDKLSMRFGDNVAYYAFIEQKYLAKKNEVLDE